MPIGLGDEQLWLCPSLDNVTPFNDLSSQGNNGTAVGGLTTVADTGSGGAYAYDLDGTDDYIDCGNAIAPTTGYSASAWVNVTSFPTGSNVGTIIEKGYDGTDEPFSFNFRTPTEMRSFTYDGTLHGVTNHVHGMSTGVWYHVATTFDGATWKLFIDGVEVAAVNDSTALVQNSLNTYVGASWGINTVYRFLDAKLDDVRLFYRALTQSEITHLATARGIEGRPFDGLGDEQLWLCPSLENSPNDLSGNNNNGAYQGSMGTVPDTSNGGSLAYDFDGIDDYLDCGDILDSQVWTAGDFAISGWIKSDGLNTVQVFNKYYNLTGNRQFHFRVINSGGNLRLNAYIHTTLGNAEYRYWLGSTNLSADTWYHVVLNYDASASSDDRASCFIDGSSETMTVTDSTGTLSTIPDGSASLAVGARVEGGSATDFRSGSSDDLRVYNRALTQSEISWLATERGVLGTPPEGLGDETCWICPTLTQNSTQDITNSGLTITTTGSVAVTADTGAGGTYANFCQGNGTSTSPNEVIVDNFGNTYAEVTSISWWSRRTAGATVIEMGMDTDLWPSAASGRFIYENWNGADRCYMYDPSGGTNGFINETGSNATWKHHVMVREGVGGKKRLYINGVLDTEEYDDAGWETTAKDTYFGIGGGSSSDSELYMDDMRTYGRVLTQDEITHLASQRGVLGAPALPTGLGGEKLWLCPSIDDSPDDLSGNGNNGVYQNGMGTVTDTAEGGTRSYEFTNSSHYITGTTDLDTTDDFSLSYWYRSNTGNSFGTNYHIFRARNGTRGFNFYKYYSSGTQTYTGTTICRGGASSNSDTPVNYGITTSDWLDWHCFTMNWDNASSTMEYFIDGVSVGTWNASVSGSVDATGTTMILGALGNGTGTANGYIDDLRKYSRKLTKAEITHLATQRGVLGAPALPTGLGGEQLWLCPTLDNATPFNDQSDQGNNGTAVGGLSTVADTGSGGAYAYDFDGQNDYITYPIAAIDSANSIGSVSAWVKTGSTANPGGQIIGGSDTASTNAWSHLRLDSGEPTVVTYSSGQVGEKQSSTNVNDSNWHHVCAVGDGSNHSIYIDGTLASSTWVGTNYGNRWLGYPAGMDSGLVGALVRSSGTGNLFDGQMDDIRVYNRVLTQSEVSWLATERGVLGTPPEGLGDEQLWLCPSIQDGANDLSGNNNNGVYQNGMGTITDTSNGGSLAYDFDGAGDYIDVTGYANSKTAYSLSTWINGTGPNQTVVAFNVGDSSGSRSLNLGLQPSATALVGHQASPSYYWAESTSTVNGAGWKHVAATYDGSDVKIYVDGVLEDTQAAPNSTTAQTRAFIGRWVGSTPFWLTGKMDDIRAYDRALTQAEITHLATSRGVLGPAPEGLGDELIWISPTLSGSGPASDITGGTTVTEQGTVSNIQDTGSGGDRALSVSSTGDQFYFDWPYITAGNIETFSFWIKKSVLNLQYGYWKVVNGNDSADAGNWTINDYGTAFGFFGITNETLPSQIPANQWSNVIITRDDTASGQQTTIYVDNVQVFQGNTSIGNRYRSQITRIGITSEITTTAEVRFDDVRIFDRIITASERSHLASQRGVLGSPTATTQYNAFLTHAFRQLFQTRIR